MAKYWCYNKPEFSDSPQNILTKLVQLHNWGIATLKSYAYGLHSVLALTQLSRQKRWDWYINSAYLDDLYRETKQGTFSPFFWL